MSCLSPANLPQMFHLHVPKRRSKPNWADRSAFQYVGLRRARFRQNIPCGVCCRHNTHYPFLKLDKADTFSGCGTLAKTRSAFQSFQTGIDLQHLIRSHTILTSLVLSLSEKPPENQGSSDRRLSSSRTTFRELQRCNGDEWRSLRDALCIDASIIAAGILDAFSPLFGPAWSDLTGGKHERWIHLDYLSGITDYPVGPQ